MTNKSYEEMTHAEREARNEAAFCWGEGDLLFLDPNTREWLGGEEFRARYGALIDAAHAAGEEPDIRHLLKV